MKPILFPEGQKDFSTNGLGRLPDAISCKVTEERNGQYELHMLPIDVPSPIVTLGKIVHPLPTIECFPRDCSKKNI